MKKYLCFFAALALLAYPLAAIASDGQQKSQPENKQGIQKEGEDKKVKQFFMAYSPPKGMNMPVKREGGATRGTGDKGPYLAVLVPNHTGLTLNNQPSLFWYISEPVKVRVEITLINESSVEPILEIVLDESNKQGVRRLNLSDHGIRLKPNVEYQWFVSIVPDTEQRSKDISATGMITQVESSLPFKEKMAKSEGIEKPAVYAQEGLWYDALASLSELIDANPRDKAFLEERIALLEQVGLKTVAEHERKRLQQGGN